MSSGYFEDIEVGDSQKAGPYSVSKDEIIQFAEKYDPRPFHIDEASAARSVFAGLSASAAHTFAIFYSLTNKLHPPIRAIAALGYDELRLPNPVRPDDELDLDVRVLEKRESKSKSQREAGDFDVIEMQVMKTLVFDRKDVTVPIGKFGNPVVGNDEGLFVGIRQRTQCNDRHELHAQ